MDEEQWLACDDPHKMLAFLRGKASDRKLRLFAVACCRRIGHVLSDERCRRLIGPEVTWQAGQFATSMKAEACWHVATMTASRCVTALGSKVGSEAARQAADRETDWGPPYSDEWNAAWDAAAEVASAPAERAEQGRQAVLLRDLFGPLPFRPVALDPAWLSWSGGTVVRLAQAAYERRELPVGTLAPDRLAVLADALEEAGCQDGQILGHLRSGGEHYRGCFVVDALLGKE
jgi:hypothetical protein